MYMKVLGCASIMLVLGALASAQGIFQAVARAREWQTITGSDAQQLSELEAWFGKNLEKPTSFGRNKLRLGICWFKTEAREHISRIWEMVDIIERNGIYVKKIRTDKPGYVIYEDEGNWLPSLSAKALCRKDKGADTDAREGHSLFLCS